MKQLFVYIAAIAIGVFILLWALGGIRGMANGELKKTVESIMMSDASKPHNKDIFSWLVNALRAAYMKLLLGLGANAGNINEFPLATAMVGDEDLLRMVDSENIDVRDVDGKTPLMHVIENGDDRLIKMMVESGTDVNASDNEGKSVLIYTITNGEDDGSDTKLVIENGAYVNARDMSGKTALMYATIEGDANTVKYLIKKGADVNAMDRYGRTALMFAVMNRNEKIARILMDNGAVDTPACMTAYEYASDSGYLDIADLLR